MSRDTDREKLWCRLKSKPPVNWWYAQGLEGPNTDLVPKGTWKFDTALQFRAAA